MQKKLAQRFPEAGLIATTILQLEDDNIPTEDCTGEHELALTDYFSAAALDPSVVHSSSAALRRDVYTSVGHQCDALTGEDLEYWARIALDFPVAVSSRATSVYYRGTEGIMEQLATRDHNIRKFSSLEDVAPAICTLCERNDREPGLLQRPSISRYINAQIMTAIRGSLYRGDIDSARSLSRLSPAPTLRLRLMLLLLTLPRPLISVLANSYRAWRAYRRSVDGIGDHAKQ